MSKPFRVLALPGSLRAKSFNRALLEYARKTAPASLAIEIRDIGDIPLFNQDVEAKGYPEPVARLQAEVAAADGILIATPEYNSGIPGVLKNALDWMSRPPGKATCTGKPVAVVGATPGISGTSRAQVVMRPVLAGMGMLQLVGADTALPGAGSAFDAEGNLVDEKARAALARTLDAFAAWIARLAPKA
ncbi:MAG: NAD(P)H-dependent oxidoreductase [Rhodospirillales bacterium]|nr:NAD(P)H-dependent oxidoreductase [Rhodospirillales bacterium]